MRFVNQLPNAKFVKREIDKVLLDNKNRLQKLQAWIESEVQRNKEDLLGDQDAITKLLINLQEKGKTFLKDVSYYAIESMAISS